MGKIGWGEFLVILIIAVIVVGPDKLPELGRALGKAVRGVKKYVNEAANEIADVDELKNIKKDVESIRSDVAGIGRDLEKSVTADLKDVEKEVKQTVEGTAADVKQELETAVAETVDEARRELDQATETANQSIKN